MLTVRNVSHDLFVKAPPPSKAAAVQSKPTKLEEADAAEEDIVAILETAGNKAGERCARVRAKVNFFANVCADEFGEDMVTCIDMSKGGVSFRS